jgi:hypothetical protein
MYRSGPAQTTLATSQNPPASAGSGPATWRSYAVGWRRRMVAAMEPAGQCSRTYSFTLPQGAQAR